MISAEDRVVLFQAILDYTPEELLIGGPLCLWAGERQRGGRHHYDGKVPIIATGLRSLRNHGPGHAPVVRDGPHR
ncbi:hypothetical protein [Streptomyces sp. NPDC001970]